MLKRIKTASALLIFALACGPASMLHAQQSDASAEKSPETNPERYFRLDFRVLQISPEGKIADSRSYNEMVASGPKSNFANSLRAQDRVPMATTNDGSQYQYLDTGADIDVKNVGVSGEMLRLQITADVSALAPPVATHEENAGGVSQTFRYNGELLRTNILHRNWSSNVSVPIGKPTIIFSSDNNADRGKMQVELTATPVP